MYRGKCGCGSTAQFATVADLHERFRECEMCAEMMCLVCASDPHVGIEENWYGTGWNVCRTQNCQDLAIKQLIDNNMELRREIRELKEGAKV
jgi:hypothetical protein